MAHKFSQLDSTSFLNLPPLLPPQTISTHLPSLWSYWLVFISWNTPGSHAFVQSCICLTCFPPCTHPFLQQDRRESDCSELDLCSSLFQFFLPLKLHFCSSLLGAPCVILDSCFTLPLSIPRTWLSFTCLSALCPPGLMPELSIMVLYLQALRFAPCLPDLGTQDYKKNSEEITDIYWKVPGAGTFLESWYAF